MLDVSALAFPASGVLAGWQRQLAPRQPRALWIGHLFFQRVETLVQSATLEPLDRFTALLLEALALAETIPSPDVMSNLCGRLHFPEAVLRHALRSLEENGLFASDHMKLTAAGRQALVQGTFARPQWQRRSFSFLERWDEQGRRVAPPDFLPVEAAPAAPWSAAPPWDNAWLGDRLGQSAAWKQASGFPQDVRALADAAPAAIPLWQRVTVVRPERLLAALALVGPAPAAQLLGFGARLAGNLPSLTPFLQLGEEGRARWPELAPEPTAQEVQSAWLLWCQRQGVTTPLAELCPCHVTDLELRVQVPALLVHELRGRRSGSAGPEWLVLGAGPVRRAVQIHVTAA